MKKPMTKEVIKIGLLLTLSIALFSGAFAGVNHAALAALTNHAESLPRIATSAGGFTVLRAEPVPVETEENAPVFIEPNLNILNFLGGRFESHLSPPAHALSLEEAAQIGARYVWDVFGEPLDGMYVTMTYVAWTGHGRTQWFGVIYPDAQAARIHGPIAPHDHSEPMFHFLIDAVTGQRVDISYHSSRTPALWTQEEMHAFGEWRRYSDQMRSWYYINSTVGLEERMEYLGVAREDLETYKQMAAELAQRQFIDSTVVDVQFGDEFSVGVLTEPVLDQDGTVRLVLGGLIFTATDDTGRTATIRLPASTGRWQGISISTQHNDIVPGFSYDRPGRG